MSDDARGGDDTLTGGGFEANICGDADEMHDNARGGNDHLTAVPSFTSSATRASWMATAAAAMTR